MAKYSGKTATSTRARQPKAPIATTDQRTHTYNGATAFVRDAKSELFVLALNFMGEQENTFYESGNDRQNRFVSLIHQVTKEDPEWMQAFIPFLRDEALMRTASVVALVEYARAGGPDAGLLIGRVLRRADEPGELLGYYWSTNGGRKTLASQIRRGLALSAEKLYTEFNVLKYDGVGHGIRMGDVIELSHPTVTSPEQNTLFAYLLDRRHHADEIRALTGPGAHLLPMVTRNRDLRRLASDHRRKWLQAAGSAGLQAAGMTWESLSEWLPGGMDAEAWEAIIPSMGYMALLRNLRNFDAAQVSDKVAVDVIARLTDPEQVAKSMQFPYRFYSAYKNMTSNRWSQALDMALDMSTSNIPKLSGRTLVLIDLSGSMGSTVTQKSSMHLWEAAAVFGVAQFRSAGFAGNIVGFGDYGQEISMRKGTSVLKGVESVARVTGRIGYGTAMWPTVRDHYDNHDRVFLFTDMQANTFSGIEGVLSKIRGPVYFWNLAGYGRSAAETGKNGVYEMTGLSDVTFRQIALLEASRDAGWPWE